jgi:hypothetical protein
VARRPPAQVQQWSGRHGRASGRSGRIAAAGHLWGVCVCVCVCARARVCRQRAASLPVGMPAVVRARPGQTATVEARLGPLKGAPSYRDARVRRARARARRPLRPRLPSSAASASTLGQRPSKRRRRRRRRRGAGRPDRLRAAPQARAPTAHDAGPARTAARRGASRSYSRVYGTHWAGLGWSSAALPRMGLLHQPKIGLVHQPRIGLVAAAALRRDMLMIGD